MFDWDRIDHHKPSFVLKSSRHSNAGPPSIQPFRRSLDMCTIPLTIQGDDDIEDFEDDASASLRLGRLVNEHIRVGACVCVSV